MTRGVFARCGLRKAAATAACATLLLTDPAGGASSAQQRCDSARVKAWKTYLSCVERKLAKRVGGPALAEPLFAKCTQIYAGRWTAFQQDSSLAGSSCIGSRFTDTGTSVTDQLTTLQWEKKTDDGSVHDVDNTYPWSAGLGAAADGDVFQTILAGLNAPACFAGQCDWRLPTIAELRTIVLDFACTESSCTCPSLPCIDAAFGPTQAFWYWSGTDFLPNPTDAWAVSFSDGPEREQPKNSGHYVRAVRGGL